MDSSSLTARRKARAIYTNQVFNTKTDGTPYISRTAAAAPAIRGYISPTEYSTIVANAIRLSSALPDAPVITSHKIADKQVVLSVSFGGSVTGLKYSTNDGLEYVAIAKSNTLTIGGLTNGETYKIRVIAINANGDSLPSTALVVKPCAVPAPPTVLSHTTGDKQLQIAFSVAAGTETIKYSLNNGASFISHSSLESPITITGLTNGTAYNVVLVATSAAGDSAYSNMVCITPFTTPDAPSMLVATPSGTSVSVAFTPGSDNGATITHYMCSINNGVSFSLVQPSNPIVITGLSNNITYRIKLKAVNAAGSSAASAAVQVTTASRESSVS